MKICYKCGERNYFSPKQDLKCNNCGREFKEVRGKMAPEHSGKTTTMTKKRMLHDEYPWSNDQGR